MGIARNIAKGTVGFFLALALFTTPLLLGLEQFTRYSNLKPIATEIMHQQLRKGLNETQLLQMRSHVNLYCKTVGGRIKLDFTFGEIEANCSEVIDKQSQQIIDVFISKGFDSIYYKRYGCKFIDCLKNVTKMEDFLVLISEHSNSFFKHAFKYSLASTALLLLAFLVACESWYSRVKDIGLILLFTALPYFGMNFLLAKFLQTFCLLKLWR